MRTVPAGEFKQRCLALLDEVGASGEPIVVTKRGKPVAQLAGPAGAAARLARSDGGAGEITGDPVAPAADPGAWDALRE